MFSISKVLKIVGILLAIKSLLTDKDLAKKNEKLTNRKGKVLSFIWGAGIGLGFITAIFLLINYRCCSKKQIETSN